MRIVTAITGASGAIYAVRFVKACLELGFRLDLVVSAYGHRLLIEECGLNLKTESMPDWLERTYGGGPHEGSLQLHRESDLGSEVASGSARWDAMVVVPCSMKTLSGIAHGTASNLIERTADVTLKERRPLVIVPRETPMNLIQIDNLRAATAAGAIPVPAMPAFYYGPKSFEDLADFIAGRVLALLGVEHDLFSAWTG